MVEGVGIFQRLIIVVYHCGNVGFVTFIPYGLITRVIIVIDLSGIRVSTDESGYRIGIGREIEFQTRVGGYTVCYIIDIVQIIVCFTQLIDRIRFVQIDRLRLLIQLVEQIDDVGINVFQPIEGFLFV